MVKLATAPPLQASTTATALVSVLGRHGFALVRASDGLAYVEAAHRPTSWRASGGDYLRRALAQSF